MSREKRSDESSGRGLQAEIHPALLSSNVNLIRKHYGNKNPYLDDEDDKKGRSRKRVIGGGGRQRVLGTFHAPGAVSREIEKQREEERAIQRRLEEQQERDEAQRRETETQNALKVATGKLPDVGIGEDKYICSVEEIPAVEWWDKPYLNDVGEVLSKYIDVSYDSDEEEDDDEEEDKNEPPSIRYVFHPVPIDIEGESQDSNKLYLTKDEHKKLRRNRRKVQREEYEARVKLGLAPKPVAKVRLANMMNVLQNDQNITDPTQWERTVKEQVSDRKRKHEETNRLRHEEAQKRRREQQEAAKNRNSSVQDTELCCRVYRFQQLANPSIRYKLKMNSEQLSLRGACLREGDTGPGMIIILGSAKSCGFYDKLVLNRLPWKEDFVDKSTNKMIHMGDNSVERVWEGYLEGKTCKFPQRWFMRVCQDKEEIASILKGFDSEHFYP